MKPTKQRFWTAPVALLAVSALLSACSSGAPTSDSGGLGANAQSVDFADILLAAPNTGPVADISTNGDEVVVDTGAAVPATFDVNETYAVAVFSPAYGNAFSNANEAGAERAAADFGVDVEFFKAGGNSQTQLDQLETAIASGKFKMLAVSPLDTNLTCPVIEKAADAGILVAIHGQLTCGLDTLPEDEWVYPGILNYVGGPANEPTSRAYAKSVAQDNPGAKAIVLGGPENAQSGQTERAATDASGLSQLAFGSTLYSKESGYEQTQILLQAHPDTTLILSWYAEITAGAVQAVTEAGLQDKIKIYDFGGGADAFDMIREGTLVATVPYFPEDQTYVSVASLVAASRGEANIPKVILNDGAAVSVAGTTYDVVDASNVDDVKPGF